MSLRNPSLSIGADGPARNFVRQRLTAFNRKNSPALQAIYQAKQDIPVPVEVYARDSTGTIVGGVYGVMRFSWLAVDVLWVSKPYRSKGLGGRLLQTAEDAAKAKGALGVLLDTLDFQARGFYEKKGYTLYGQLENFPGTHTKFLLAKRFSPPDLLQIENPPHADSRHR